MSRIQPASACAVAETDDLVRRFASFDADKLIALLYDMVFEDVRSLAASSAYVRVLSRIVSVIGAVNICLSFCVDGMPVGDIGPMARFGDETSLAACLPGKNNETS